MRNDQVKQVAVAVIAVVAAVALVLALVACAPRGRGDGPAAQGESSYAEQVSPSVVSVLTDTGENVPVKSGDRYSVRQS